MNEFQPGDRVVELGAMVGSVTTAAGAVSSAWLLFSAKQSGGRCFAGFLAGALCGFLVGLVLARLLYAAGGGNVQVVRAAPESLAVLLRAALLGALCQTMIVLLCLGCLGMILSWPAAAAAALGANLLIAVAVARVSVL